MAGQLGGIRALDGDTAVELTVVEGLSDAPIVVRGTRTEAESGLEGRIHEMNRGRAGRPHGALIGVVSELTRSHHHRRRHIQVLVGAELGLEVV